MVLVAQNTQAPGTQNPEPSVPVTHPLNGKRKPPKSPQALAKGIREGFSYLSAEQAAKAGGAGCAPRGQGEEGVAALGRGGCGRWDLEGGAGLHRW